MAVRKGGNFLNLLQKEGVPRKGRLPQKRGVPTLEETMALFIFNDLRNIDRFPL